MVNAQLITLSPEKPGFNEETILTFHADEGNKGLVNCECDIYAHTGLITNQSTHGGDWKKVVADWGANQDKLKLDRVGNNTYQLKFKIADLYGIPTTGGNVVALAFVFRNEDGSKVGKEKGGKDIFHFFKKPNFKKPPKIFTYSEAIEPEWAKYASVYEVNVRQYTKEGTFDAFSEHLPRLRNMGIDILWFMPIQPIGVKKRKGTLGSYYSIKDYTAINPEFGTMEDFKTLVNKAHGMGFKVILDWVANHSAWDNAWAENHPNWYTRDDNGEMVAPFDWSDVADLNFDNYYLRKAMAEAMIFWVKDVGLDGFRCDVAGEVPSDFWEDTRAKIDKIKPVWMVAENADQLWLLNKAFNANYGWHLHHVMNEIAKGHESVNAIFDYFEGVKHNFPKGAYPMQFITNHDENSWAGTVYERLGEGHKAFAVLTFTIPGIPLIYSGQEAGLNKRLEFFEKDEIDWSDESLIPFYTKLNELKAENPALWNGNAGGWIERIENDHANKVVAFSREKGNSQILSIINLSGERRSVTLKSDQMAGKYREHFSGDALELSETTKMDLQAWEYKVLIRQ